MLHRLIPRSLAVFAAAAVLAACGGGGGGGAVPGGGGGGGLPASSTISIAANSSAPASGSFATILGGFSATVTVPATTSGSGQITATLTTTPPSGVPAVQSAARRPKNIGGSLTPLAYFTVASAATLSFNLTPGASVTVPSGTSGYGYLGFYDPTNGWTAVAGATTLVSGQYVFSPLDSNYTIVPGTTGTFAVFTSPTLVAVNPPGNDDGTSCDAYQQGTAGHRRAPRVAVSAAASVVPNQLYVTTRSSQRTPDSVRSLTGAIRSLPLGGENGLVHQAITLPAGADATRVAAQLRATAGVVDVQPVHRRFLEGDSAANDTLLNNDDQWYLYITNVDPGAWAITHGTGITVAVIDTGVDETNQDLAPKLSKTEGIVGGVITSSAQDTNGHGTNVSGLVAATTNNGYGYAATGWDVHLLAYKIFPDATNSSDCQSATTADEAAAIRDAVANGASVVSLSLGSPQDPTQPGNGADAAEQSAVNYALQNNVTVVAANGNEGPGMPPDFPPRTRA